MQNTGNTQIMCREHRFPLRLPLLAAACALFAALVALACAPTPALAKSYTMPEVNIDAEVMPNGDLHVVEKRHFSFDGSYSCVYWNFESSDVDKADRHGYTVNSVKIAQYDSGQESSAKTQKLNSVPFQSSWRESGGPGKDAWSYDKAGTSLYVFFSDADYQDMTVTIDYTVDEAAIAYEDVGEIYWKYVGSGWDADSENVTCTIHTPVPIGTKVQAGDNLRAWGHGPLDGTVNIASDGTVVYKVDKISSGQYGEARVVFPVEWLTKLSASAKKNHGDELGLDTILEEEQNWADVANAQRIGSLVFIIAFIVISLALIVWAILMFLRHGRELKPEFQDEYWRDMPDKSLHPAVVGRCWRFDQESTDDLTATLMHLSALGAIAINKGTYQQKGIFGRQKDVEGMYLTRIPAVADTLTDELDTRAMKLIFDTVAGGKDSLWMSEIQTYAKDHAEHFTEEVKSWQGVLTARSLQAEIFEPKGPHRRTVMNLVAIVYGVIGVVACMATVNFLPLIAVIPTVLVLLVFARFMERRTRKGAELQAHSKALRSWLRDFTHTDEQPPTGVKVWGEFMVYAYLFGVAEQVIKQLKITMPELFDEDAMVVGGYSYMPFFWYTGGIDGSPVTPGFDIFDAAVQNSFDVVEAATSAAEGFSSSGGGFGGGFSVGGGGGFGGGGGAR